MTYALAAIGFALIFYALSPLSRGRHSDLGLMAMLIGIAAVVTAGIKAVLL